jgi:hypothetical protein
MTTPHVPNGWTVESFRAAAEANVDTFPERAPEQLAELKRLLGPVPPAEAQAS